MTTIVPVPDFRITMDGKELTSRMKPRLVDLSLSEKRGGEADQLDITLSDHDGGLGIPEPGVRLTVQIGWLRGTGVPVGLVNKGDFIVDAVNHDGPPDIITLRARSADLSGDLRTRREGSWTNTTMKGVITDIAGRNRLTPRIAEKLAKIAVTSIVQSRESDMALLKRLGKEHDAVATIKGGALIFAPIGAGITASGQTIPPASITRRDGDKHRFSIEKQDESTGVEASYHDLKSGKKKKVQAGEKGKMRKLSRTYPGEAAARAAANAEHGRRGRLPRKLSFDLALGRADLYPERKVTVRGWKPEIDNTSWLIAGVSHRLSNSGFTTSIEMEAI